MTIDQFIFEKLFPDEKWHEVNVSGYCFCGARAIGKAKTHAKAHNPDFSTGDGMLKLKERLVELGMWQKFLEYSYDFCEEKPVTVAAITAWLIDQPRFRNLVGQFLGWEEK